MKPIAYAVALLSLALLLQGGCPSSPANPPNTSDPNTGGTSNNAPVVEGATDTSGGQPVTTGLTTELQDLVRLLVSKQVHALQMFGTVAPLTGAGVIPTTDGSHQSGTCPMILNERHGSTIGIVLTYPPHGLQPACTNEYGTFAEQVNILIDYTTPVATVTWTGSWVNGDYVSGTLGGTPPLSLGVTDTFLQGSSISSDGKNLRGLLAFIDKEPGPQGALEMAIAGYVQVTLDPEADTILMNRVGWLYFNEVVNKFETEMADVICDPVKHGNYIPYYGVLRFTPYADNSWYGQFNTLKIEFLADSPTTHAVQVTLDATTPCSVTLSADCLPQ